MDNLPSHEEMVREVRDLLTQLVRIYDWNDDADHSARIAYERVARDAKEFLASDALAQLEASRPLGRSGRRSSPATAGEGEEA